MHDARSIPIDPLQVHGWDGLLAANPGSHFFQGTPWARVLRDTYGHRPFYFCSISSSGIDALLPVMEISSRIAGTRGVSLPFTDSVPVLNFGSGDAGLHDAALAFGASKGWRHFESRSGLKDWPGSTASVSFYRHIISLEGGEGPVYQRLGSAVRRGVRKANNGQLKVEFSTSPEAVRSFYKLHIGTRRRHGVPPQPFRFFENIARHILAPGHGFVSTVRVENRPIASAVFFRYQRQAVYKFGASDYHFQHLRPNNLLIWESMKRCMTEGCLSLDLGKTSLANAGLRRFKLDFGAAEETLDYARFDLKRRLFIQSTDRSEGLMNKVFRCFPSRLFQLAGQILYPHLS